MADHFIRNRLKKTRRKKDEKLRNKYGDSIEHWEKIVKAKPESITSWVVLGQFYEKIRDWNKAFECFNKVLEIEPYYKDAMLSKKRLERKIASIYKKGPLWEYEH